MVRKRIRDGLIFCSLVLAAGCGSSGGVRERADAATGLTWVAASEPGVYALTDPRYSRAARDYVYIGPVETNAQGMRQYYLWVGVGSTLDRGLLPSTGQNASRITMLIDGEPIVLDLMPWAQLMGGATSIEPYDPPVRPLVEYGSRVTRDLLTRINTHAPAALRLADRAGESRQFFAWSPMPRWAGFAADENPR